MYVPWQLQKGFYSSQLRLKIRSQGGLEGVERSQRLEPFLGIENNHTVPPLLGRMSSLSSSLSLLDS